MKFSLKATHAIKGNSKEVSQPGERLPEVRKDGDKSLGHAERRKPERQTKNASIYMPSPGMNAQKSNLISDPVVGKAFKYFAQYLGVMQGSQEGKRAKSWGLRTHFGTNISMKIVVKFVKTLVT